jgi:hypothetical protein
MIARRCARCGQSFAPRRADARFCGPKCRSAAHRARKKSDASQAPAAAEERPVQDQAAKNDGETFPIVVEVDPISGRPTKTVHVDDLKAAIHASRDPRIWHRLG